MRTVHKQNAILDHGFCADSTKAQAEARLANPVTLAATPDLNTMPDIPWQFMSAYEPQGECERERDVLASNQTLTTDSTLEDFERFTNPTMHAPDPAGNGIDW